MNKRKYIVSIGLLFACCFALLGVWVKHNRDSKAQYIQHDNFVPMVPNPDFKKIGKNQDDAYDAAAHKEYAVAMHYHQLNLSEEECKSRMQAVRDIGNAEIARVRATGDTQSFNPDVWKKLPADIASFK